MALVDVTDILQGKPLTGFRDVTDEIASGFRDVTDAVSGLSDPMAEDALNDYGQPIVTREKPVDNSGDRDPVGELYNQVLARAPGMSPDERLAWRKRAMTDLTPGMSQSFQSAMSDIDGGAPADEARGGLDLAASTMPERSVARGAEAWRVAAPEGGYGLSPETVRGYEQVFGSGPLSDVQLGAGHIAAGTLEVLNQGVRSVAGAGAQVAGEIAGGVGLDRVLSGQTGKGAIDTLERDLNTAVDVGGLAIGIPPYMPRVPRVVGVEDLPPIGRGSLPVAEEASVARAVPEAETATPGAPVTPRLVDVTDEVLAAPEAPSLVDVTDAVAPAETGVVWGKPPVEPRQEARKIDRPFDLTPEQLDEQYLNKTQSEKDLLIRALGEEQAKEFLRLERARNNSYDMSRADAASREFEAKFGNLTPEQERLIYGLGEVDASAEDLDMLRRAREPLDGLSVDDLGQFLSRSMIDVTPQELRAVLEGRDAPIKHQAAAAQMQTAMEALARAGASKADIDRAVMGAMARRGYSADDANEVLGAYMNVGRKEPAASALPAPAGFKDVTAEVMPPDAMGSDAPKGLGLGERVRGFVQSVISKEARRDTAKRTVDLGPVSEPEAWAIRYSAAASGVDLDVTGFSHEMDNFGVRHTVNSHGKASTENPRGLLPVTEDDFARVPEIIASAKPEYGGKSAIGEHTIRYKQAFGDDLIELEYVAEHRGGRKTLALKTMTKRKLNSGASGGLDAGALPTSAIRSEPPPGVTTADNMGAAPVGVNEPRLGLLDDRTTVSQGPVPQASVLRKDKRSGPVEDPFAMLKPRVVETPKGGKVTFGGPLDLVTWLRTLGGLKDYQGELRHLGVNNKSRGLGTRVDTEKFIGPILSDNGFNLDDAALRAWEEGYFPDHAERPSISDFLEAVGETFNGSNRRYHPRDLEELAIHDQVDQMYREAEDVGINTQGKKPGNVYRMLQEHYASLPENGRPLAESDVPYTEAPTVDDIWQAPLGDAPGNVQAPGMSSEAPRYVEGDKVRLSKPERDALKFKPSKEEFAGNIRLENINGVEDISAVLQGVADEYGGFEPARRGVQSHDATQALADDMGMSYRDLTKRTKGQAFNAEQAVAARQLLASSADDLMSLSKRIAEGKAAGVTDNALLFEFQQAYTRHVAIQEQVAGLTAEAGRALNSFKIVAKSDRLKQEAIRSLLADGKGAKVEEIAEKMATLDDPAAVNKFARDAFNPKLSDKLIELWINGLLSGPETHVVNAISNTAFQLWQLPENLVAATIGRLRNGADIVRFREIAAQAGSYLEGAREGLSAAWQTFKTEEPTDPMAKADQLRYRALGASPVAQAVRIPSRLLMTSDEFFKGVAYRTELNGLAVRKAIDEGLKGKAFRARVEDLKANPSDDMILKATDHQRYVTFTDNLGDFGQSVQKMVNTWPALRIIFPFVRTPSNLLKRAAERTPVGFFMKGFREAEGVARDKAMARIITGSAVGALVVKMASDGLITGSGPTDPARRRELQGTGWRPYSLKIGESYVPFARVDPFSSLLGIYADVGEAFGPMSDEEKNDAASLITASIAANLVNKTYLQGLSELANVLASPDRYGAAYVQGLFGTLIPTGAAQVARESDPVVRDLRPDPTTEGVDRQLATLANSLKARIPGMTEDLPARRDVWGSPVRRDEKLAPPGTALLSPFRISPTTNDPVRFEVNRLKMGLTEPDRKLEGVELSPEEYGRYSEMAGEISHRLLKTAMVQEVTDPKTNETHTLVSPRWIAAPDGMKREIITRAVRESRDLAKQFLMRENPDLARRIVGGKVEKKLRVLQ